MQFCLFQIKMWLNLSLSQQFCSVLYFLRRIDNQHYKTFNVSVLGTGIHFPVLLSHHNNVHGIIRNTACR